MVVQKKTPVNWFQGLANSETVKMNEDVDTLESYITIGSKRVPLFAETKRYALL